MRGATPYSVFWVDSTVEKGVPEGIPVSCFDSAAEARKSIEDPERNIAAIFVNPVLSGTGGLSLISAAHRARPATPVFAIYEREKPFSRTELDRMGILEAFTRSEAASKVRVLLSREIFDSVPKKILYPPKQENGYIAVPAQDFLCGTPSFFDIYVHLPSGKFLKVVHAKDSFAPSRVKAYIARGVTHFHLRTESHLRCLSFCDNLADYLLTHPDISFELKATETMNRGHELIKTIRRQGLGTAEVDFSGVFVANTHQLVQAIDRNKNSDLQTLLKHAPAYDHAVLTTVLAGLLSLPLKIESKSTFRILGLAAFLHDIGLYSMPAALHHEDQDRMTEAELAQYRTHPVAGARILKSLGILEDTIIQAVAQHHDRRDNRGFPRQTRATEINRIAEIIGMAEAYAHLLVRKRGEPALDVYAEMEMRAFPGYTLPVVEAFRAVFMSEGQNR